MGLRLQRRINLGGGAGINVSKSGFSPSLRTKIGTIGAKGFTIRTGIPGLYYRDVFKKSKKGNDGIFLIILLAIGVFVLMAIVVWNVLQFLLWIITEFIHYLQRLWYKRQIAKEAERSANSDKVFFTSFSQDKMPQALRRTKVVLESLLVDDKSVVEKDTEIAMALLAGHIVIFTADEGGRVTFLMNLGDKIRHGDYVFKIEKE
jgi:hypothetical protein